MTNLPRGWEVKKLGDIVKLKNGFAFKSNLFCDIGIPIIRIKNIQNENIVLDDLVFCNPNDYKNNLDNYLIQKNDILIAMSGATTGKIGLYNLNNKAYLNQRVGLLRINNDILRKYIFWFLYCNSEQNLTNAFGAAQPNLSTEQIHNIQIPLPPLKEQERIVGILDESFAKIDESIKILEQNLLNLDELMQSALQKAFNPLKDNAKENYKLPQGWEWKSLGEISNLIQNGFAASKNNEIPSGYVHLRTHNISTDGNLNFDTLIKIKREFIKEKQSFIEKNDILFNNTNSTELVGKTALVTQNYNYAFSNHLTKIKLKNQYNSKLVVFYFVLLLKNKYFEKICHQWIGQSGINIDKLKKIQIPLPPLKEQEQIAKHLDFVFEKTKALKELYTKELKDYEELKQSLLNKAFKGEL
ncbi:TPA: restriction endonuclease subunit S [Campylobacter jejuni]|nr:restriction endonuclease subunit S [Campylobacter jejuni]HDZ5374859.1 restriction endonuclease subunit S [Campylobacter jejuni]HED1112710.1 restriction endonuclease subunit S [Campylobacter jejuni]HEG8301856.1 restriction endonuclease subunit S [Campylobacter jejuni]HEG8352788.1 restriction endonuclease subunit S [Campylobacter jejuni]